MFGNHKSALEWMISSLKGISPLVCTHRIFLKEGTKLAKEMQRKLNSTMQEVVRSENLKLLKTSIIY